MKENDKIKPSDRVSDIKEYYFSIKLREVAAMKASGIDVISLGIGGPDQPPHDEVIETMTQALHVPTNHGYQPHTGAPELRKAFADWYRRWYGVDVDPAKELQPLIGSKEGVTHISLAFLNPGDGVLIPNPGYPTYSSISKLLGAEIFPYNLTEENGWQPDFEELEKMPLERIKLMWINYPHMPTGAGARMDTFRKVIEFGKKHNIVIVHDNPYSFILNKTPLSIMQVEGAKDIAIEMNSLSKSHNMPGWRVGVAVSNPQFISWILKVKSNIDSGQFRPLMLAAAKALEAGPEWHEKVNALYALRRKVAEDIMHELGCEFDPTQTGLFLWGRIKDPAVSSEALADKVLQQAHVFLTPGFIFGSNGERYIRISLCASEEAMQEAFQRIKNMN
ncbi:MAG: aminotransferase class I/II-fold pyridoxal phosphate-dependent enzyme [Bacteroidales bacterium]|nr:aminotransferase class I/II-fold pyridoxal phosphate-dependent enzyme [Bacteroidales bacterium]